MELGMKKTLASIIVAVLYRHYDRVLGHAAIEIAAGHIVADIEAAPEWQEMKANSARWKYAQSNPALFDHACIKLGLDDGEWAFYGPADMDAEFDAAIAEQALVRQDESRHHDS